MSGTPEEFAEAVRWAAAKFEGKADTPLASGYLTVHLKPGQVGKNQVITQGYGIYATGGSPLLIVDKEYRQGLYCPSCSPGSIQRIISFSRWTRRWLQLRRLPKRLCHFSVRWARTSHWTPTAAKLDTSMHSGSWSTAAATMRRMVWINPTWTRSPAEAEENSPTIHAAIT
jgi:hypothetical protein